MHLGHVGESRSPHLYMFADVLACLESSLFAATQCFLLAFSKPGSLLHGSFIISPPGGILLFHSSLQVSGMLKSSFFER